VSDYKYRVQLAAKGLAEREHHPLPESATTREAFYEVMATAALEAIDLAGLLERAERAERELAVIREALGRADVEAKSARHRAVSDEAASAQSSIECILGSATIGADDGATTHDPCSHLPPADLKESVTVGNPRRTSVVHAPVRRPGDSKREMPSCQPPRQRTGRRRTLTNCRLLIRRQRRQAASDLRHAKHMLASVISKRRRLERNMPTANPFGGT
jgi:hypothetical protein